MKKRIRLSEASEDLQKNLYAALYGNYGLNCPSQAVAVVESIMKVLEKKDIPE